MNIADLIAAYHPPKDAIDAINDAKIALIAGISGAGKDTIKKQILLEPDFHDIVSHTTRAPRENEGVREQGGVDYHFIDEDTARKMIENGEFVEAKLVHGTVYGTSIAAVQEASVNGIAVTDVDVQGVEEYKKVSSDVVAIFIVPPSYDEWLRRLKRRYATEEDFLREWPKRRDSAIKELTRALELPYYHCVINDELPRAVQATTEIARRPDVFTRKDDEARLVARDLLREISM